MGIIETSPYGKNILYSDEYHWNELKQQLFFQKSFMKGKIAMEDNYQVVEELTQDIHYLDSVILSKIYNMIDEYEADKKSSLVIRKYRNR